MNNSNTNTNIPQKVRGMQDIFGENQRYFTFIKKVARHEFRKNGFTRITTPILESKDLIVRSIGLGTDIVSKEMYDLLDKKGRELVLKPESTAGVMRAYIENLLDEPQPVHLYYIEPHFRYERPQKGRYRQFHQLGAEVIGEGDPVIDAKLIYLGKCILDSLGLNGDYKIKINSIGLPKEREKYITELKSFFANKVHLLDETDAHRLENNPLRILDSKNEDTKELLKFAPKVTDFLKKESKEFYEKTKEYLDILGVEYEEDPSLVRGLDYYVHTVFEFVDNTGRSQDALLGGGRYDGLSKTLGNKTDIPASGFGMGMERIVIALQEKGVKLKNKDKIDLYLIQLGEEAKKIVLSLDIEARKRGLNSLLSVGTPSIKTQMKKAHRFGAKFVAVMGIMEARKGVCQLKNMELGTQEEVKIEDLLNVVIDRVGVDKLDFYNPAKDFIIEEKKEEENQC